MQHLLYRLFHANKISPPRAVFQAFKAAFGQTVNVEWQREDHRYEAMFYIDSVEHIAVFTPLGHLIETKRNLSLDTANEHVRHQAALIGELMNLIEISRDNRIFYDVIARDAALDRYYLLLDDQGTVLEKKKL